MMMRRPRASSSSRAFPPDRAAATAAATSSGVWSDSTTSSRVRFCTPIVISTVTVSSSLYVCGSRAGRPRTILGGIAVPEIRADERRDAAPREPRHELGGLLDADGAALPEPVRRRRLRHAGEGGREQLRLL